MKTRIRRELAMAQGAVQFCATNPDPNPATAQVGIKLADLVGRATTLMQANRTAIVNAASAVDRKEELRNLINLDLVALAGTSKAAAGENPNLTVHLRLPRRRSNEPTFLTVARVAVAEAEAHKDVFLGHGMPVDLLQTMTAHLDEFAAAIARQRNAIAAKVGSAAELDAVTAEIMAVIRHLDALNKLRFKDNADLRAAWKSARNVAWVHPDDEPPPAPSDPAPVTPPADSIKSA